MHVVFQRPFLLITVLFDDYLKVFPVIHYASLYMYAYYIDGKMFGVKKF